MILKLKLAISVFYQNCGPRKYVSRTKDKRWLNSWYFAAHIQIQSQIQHICWPIIDTDLALHVVLRIFNLINYRELFLQSMGVNLA